jgi:hypothetical protein
MSLSPFHSKRFRKSNSRCPAARRSRLQSLETLEQRQMLSVTAMNDYETVIEGLGSVTVEVLGNDVDAAETRVQSVSAANYTVDASSAWSVTETGAAPNSLTTTTTNTGDVEIS